MFALRARALIVLFLALYVPLSMLRGAALLTLEVDEQPSLADTFLFVAVVFVLPALAGSIAVAVSAIVVGARLDGEDVGIREAARELGPVARDVITAAMIAIVLAMGAATVGLYQVLHPLFLGPPILIHAIALEKDTFREAWGRTKALLRGNWARAILYLLVVGMGLTIVHTGVLLALAAASTAQDVSGRALTAVLQGPISGILNGFLLPVLAGVMLSVYLAVRDHQGSAEGDD